MKTFLIANQKGGVAKTTTATALSYLLNQMGYKTLLIDADRQGNSTDTARAVIKDMATLYDVMLEDDGERVPVSEAIQKTSLGDFVASDPLLSRASKILSADIDGIYRLNDALKNLDGYDYVIIDSGPQLDDILHSALIACDEVIIPLRAERYAVQGLSQIVDTIEKVKRHQNPNLKIAGFLLTQYDDRKVLYKKIRESLEGYAETIGTKVFTATIPVGIKVGEAQTERMSLLEYAPKSKPAIAYKQFAEELLGL